ncbi:MAG TPA: hypothetical protein VFV86_11285 [Nitrososphaeraceae archaeon]|nr:hypothetical protein [Nitrososphaeraceae archaeon]
MSKENSTNPNVKDLRSRYAIKELIVFEWKFWYRDEIRARIDTLKQFLTNEESKTRIDDSFETFSRMIKSLTGEREYLEKENSTDFRDLISALDNSMKDFFDSFMKEEKSRGNNIYHKGDALGSSTLTMYKVLGERRNTETNIRKSNIEKMNNDPQGNDSNFPKKQLLYVYPSINWLIHELRNSYTHRNPIRENMHREKIKYLDNYFSLSATVLLSMYSYLEMLDVWVDTYKVSNK